MTTVSTTLRESLISGKISEILLDLTFENERVPGWISVKGNSQTGPDLLHDMREELPFLNSTVSAVYARYIMEYLTLEDGTKLLKECLRVLKPGTPMRIEVLDFEILARKYMRKDRRFFAEVYADEGGPPEASVSEAFVATLYGRERQCSYDFSLLRDRMVLAGFTSVSHSKCRASQYKVFMQSDFDNRLKYSLFIEGKKPIDGR